MRMADKETVSDWGVCLSRHLQLLVASFPDWFPPECIAELKRDRFYGGLPKRLKVMVAYLMVGPQVRTYLDYLRPTREAEKEDSDWVVSEPPGLQSNRQLHLNLGPLASFPWGNWRVFSHSPRNLPYVWHNWRKKMHWWWGGTGKWWPWWNWGSNQKNLWSSWLEQ